MAEYASKGVAGTGLGLGAGALGISLLNGSLGNVLNGNNNHCCSDDMPVNRFELKQADKIAALETQIALRDANTYTLSEVSKVKEYLENKIDINYKEQAGINMQQAAYNASNTAAIQCISGQVEQLNHTIKSVTQTIVPRNLVVNTCCNRGENHQ